MTERPILFSAPMVRALLEGRKTQTRRIAWNTYDHIEGDPLKPMAAQRIKPGDTLWVRETHCFYGGGLFHAYQATPPDGLVNPRWRPSIHMPRALSRITLKVTATRIEHLQDISETDATAEGFVKRPEISVDPEVHRDAARDWFMDLWQELHGIASWDRNPWVVVLTFEIIKP